MARIFKRVNNALTIMVSNEVTRETIKRFDETEIDASIVTEFENNRQKLLVVVLDKTDSDRFKQLVGDLPKTERDAFKWEENDCTCQLEFDAYWAYWTYKLTHVARENESIEEVFREANGYGHDAERILTQVLVKALRKGLEG